MLNYKLPIKYTNYTLSLPFPVFEQLLDKHISEIKVSAEKVLNMFEGDVTGY